MGVTFVSSMKFASDNAAPKSTCPAGHVSMRSRIEGTLLEAFGRDVARLTRDLGRLVARGLRNRRETLRAVVRSSAQLATGSDGLLRGPALDGFQVWAGQVADTAVASAAAPPLRGIAHGVGLAEDGNDVALVHGQIDTVALLRLGVVVIQETAEIQFGGIRSGGLRITVGTN